MNFRNPDLFWQCPPSNGEICLGAKVCEMPIREKHFRSIYFFCSLYTSKSKDLALKVNASCSIWLRDIIHHLCRSCKSRTFICRTPKITAANAPAVCFLPREMSNRTLRYFRKTAGQMTALKNMAAFRAFAINQNMIK